MIYEIIILDNFEKGAKFEMSIVHLLINNFADILAFSLGIPTESRSFVEP